MNERRHSHPIWPAACAALTAALLLTADQPAAAQPGWALSHQKISDTEGGFTGILDDADLFGYSATSLGDSDGDGLGDLAVGAFYDGDGGSFHGAVWLLFLQCNPCDMNCDDSVDAFDIETFLDLPFGGGVPCGTCAGAANGNGGIYAFDIEPFLECLFP